MKKYRGEVCLFSGTGRQRRTALLVLTVIVLIASCGVGERPRQAMSEVTSPGSSSTPVTAPPDGWQCDPIFYGNEDGCDCDCGAPDPDCDLEGGSNAGQVTSACDSCAGQPCHMKPVPSGCGGTLVAASGGSGLSTGLVCVCEDLCEDCAVCESLTDDCEEGDTATCADPVRIQERLTQDLNAMIAGQVTTCTVTP